MLLDEFPLFRLDVIEALRQPLESGDITVARREESVTLPALGMLVLACNPCPCGGYSESAGGNRCTCRPQQRRDYRGRIDGPISDRIDITRHIGPLRPHEHDRFSVVESSSTVRERVAAARERQHHRYRDCGWRLNSQVPGVALRDVWPVTPPAQRLLDDALYTGRLSSRGAVRVHRLAWTVADLGAVEGEPDRTPDVPEVEVALRLRLGEPLLSATLDRRAG